MKALLLFLIFSISLSVLASEDVRIESDKKFEIIKLKKFTEIYMINNKMKKKIKIFSEIIRDDVRWIYSPVDSKKTIIVTRPMIAGPEASNFWLIESGKSRHIGKTKCLNNEVKQVTSKQIEYICLSIDPKDPLKFIEEKVSLVIK